MHYHSNALETNIDINLCFMRTLKCVFVSSNRTLKLVRDSGRSNHGWTQWFAPHSFAPRAFFVIGRRFIERVTNNVEICVSDVHCRLECGGAAFHVDDNKVPWPHFAVGVRIERFNMGRAAPSDARKVTTSFGIGVSCFAVSALCVA